MLKKIVLSFLLVFLSFNVSFAASVEALGESKIVNDDIPSAKNIAISRAKWNALEQVSGVKVKLDTIISNAELIDEAVKSEVSAVVKSFKIIDEGKDGDTYWVAIKADIVPDTAKNLISNFSQNTSIAVIIPATLQDGEVMSNNPFASEVIKNLSNNGFQVIDILSEKNISKVVADALKSNNFDKLKEIAYTYMANTFLIGNVNVLSKGNNIGYAKVDFSITSGELSWKLITKKDNSMVILDSGSMASRGQGATDKDAAYSALRNMAKNSAIKLSSQVSEKLLGDNEKVVLITLKGDRNIRYLKELKDDVKNIPFVLDIKEQGISAVSINYPENTYYLATFLTRNNKYRVVKIEKNELIIERR